MTRMTRTRIGMMLLQLLLNSDLIFAMANNTCKDWESDSLDPFDYRLPSEVAPRHYNIELKHTDSTFHGYSRTVVEVIRRTENITFHAYELRIYFETISLFKHERGHDDQEIEWKKLYHCDRSQTIVIKFWEELLPGNYTLNMKFRSHLRSGGGFRADNKVQNLSRSYVTQFRPTGARRMFPCWDEPKFKATFSIFVEHPWESIIFSNMPYKGPMVTVKSGGLHILETTLGPTPAMSTYQLTIAIVVQHSLNYALNGNIGFWFTPKLEDQTYVVHRFAKLADSFLKNYTNNLWERWTILTYPHFPSDTVGGWGFAAFSESDLLYKPNSDFPGRKLEIWRTIAKEMARQSMESFVSPKEWSHHWLHNAFATYLSYKIVGKNYEDDIMMQLFVVQVLQPAMHNDIALRVPPVIHDYDSIYSPLVCKKASAIIRMLEHIVTEEVLQKALARYITTYAYGSATLDDFLKILKNELDRSEIRLECDISNMMRTWLSLDHYPMVLILQSGDETILSAVPYQPKKFRNKVVKCQIPVTFAREMQHLTTRDWPILWLNSTEYYNDYLDYYGIHPKNCLVYNVQQFGYYRVNYEYEYWVKIVKQLKKKDHTAIHVLNRAQIIDDAYHLVMWDEFCYDLFYDLVAYLQKETDYIPWHAMMNVLHYMSPFFNYPQSKKFKKHMLNIMGEVLTKIGYDEDPQDDDMRKTLRLLLLNWACKHGHAECRKRAYAKLEAHIEDPKNNPILPGWKDWIYCAGMMNADSEFWMYFNIKNLHDEKIFKHLDCIEDENLIKRLVGLTTFRRKNWPQWRVVQLKKLYHRLVKKHARKSKVLNFTLSYFDKILNYSHMTKVEGIADLIMSMYSTCQINQIKTYVYNNSDWDAQTRSEVTYLTNFRLNQITDQKTMFMRYLHDEVVIFDQCY